MEEQKTYVLPVPVLDAKEGESIQALTARYEKLIAPSLMSRASKKVGALVPEKVKAAWKELTSNITEADLYRQTMEVVAKGFEYIEQQAAKYTISAQKIIERVNAVTPENEISSMHEICLARGYDISKIVQKNKIVDASLALTEGAATGVVGFAGLPFNLVLSTFLYFRAVQAVAMFYGYDVKNEPAEMVIASEVFANAFNPSQEVVDGAQGIGAHIGKVLLIAELTVVKQTAKKTWTEMAQRGGLSLLVTQIRALANAAARKALSNAGKKGLENNLFKNVLELIGKNLSKNATRAAIPVASAVIGALFDFAQMNKIIEYADLFYHKRFLIEKEQRIADLVSGQTFDAESVLVEGDFEEAEEVPV